MKQRSRLISMFYNGEMGYFTAAYFIRFLEENCFVKD